MKHQNNAVHWMRTVRHPALFMDMRLGKTLTVIRWAVGAGLTRVLVVAPRTVLQAWADELDREGEAYTIVEGTPKKRRFLARCTAQEYGQPACSRRWFLIGYETLRCTPDIAGVVVRKTDKRTFVNPVNDGCDWDAVVLDESTKIKNPKATITKVCTRGFRGVPHRVILSGLPAPEGLQDYYSQMQFLRGGFMNVGNFWAWRAKHFHSDDGWTWYPNAGVREAITDRIGQYAFVMTRQEAGIGERRVRQRRHFGMTIDQRKAFVNARDQFERKVDGGVELTKWAMVRFQWMLRASGGMSPDGQHVLNSAKFRELVNLLTGELKWQPVVVWFHFNAEIEAAARILWDAKVRAFRVTGEIPVDQRHERIATWGEVGGALLIQEKIGQFGIDLAAADCAIRFSHGFSQEVWNQSRDRIVHPKKKRPLLDIDFITSNSTDDAIVDLQNMKRLDARSVLVRVLDREDRP